MNTEYLKINSYQPERKKIKYVVEVLKRGGLVVLPTETVYGIGFAPDSEIAWQKIGKIKMERRDKPYSFCISNIGWLKNYPIEESSNYNLEQILDLLPGPITFILEIKNKGKVGFRIPANLITQEVIRLFSGPICLPSANESNQTPARSVQEAMDNLWGKVDLIVDGGFSSLCLPSVVLDLTQNPVRILRKGPPFVTGEIKRRFKI